MEAKLIDTDCSETVRHKIGNFSDWLIFRYKILFAELEKPEDAWNFSKSD